MVDYEEFRSNLTTRIQFTCRGDVIYMSMGKTGIGLKKRPSQGKDGPQHVNMQDDEAAFEAWAILLHVHCGKEIRLTLDSNVILPDKNGLLLSEKTGEYTYGHYNRFLYRVMKFRRQFKAWFEIADERLTRAVDQFEQAMGAYEFCNNKPEKEAAEYPTKAEAAVEAAFGRADRELLAELAKTKSPAVSKLYRQLPVGLFLNEPKAEPQVKTAIFTGKLSAIDLWGLSGDDFAIYELKTNNNKMVGIITELMFYANFIYDMFVDRTEENKWHPRMVKKDYRGSLVLWETYKEKKLRGVKAFMLTDGLHPLITPAVLEKMSGGGIQYNALDYTWSWVEEGKEAAVVSVKDHR